LCPQASTVGSGKMSAPPSHRKTITKSRPVTRHKLVCGWSFRIDTMMQSYASAAQLRGGGPILQRCLKPCERSGSPPPRILSAGPTTTACQTHVAYWAGRSTTPSGISPAVISRQSAMSSLRASAQRWLDPAAGPLQSPANQPVRRLGARPRELAKASEIRGSGSVGLRW
jgi:hypothetical protein